MSAAGDSPTLIVHRPVDDRYDRTMLSGAAVVP
jgi:hypothetical protein